MTKYDDQNKKEELLTELKTADVNITFKKLNGDVRNMKCTLRENVIPKADKEDHLSQKKIRNISEEVLAVWDLEKNAWRSMRWENIIEVSND